LPKALQRSDWGAPVLSEGQIAYAALDAVLAFQLWCKMCLELHAKGLGAAYVLQRDVTPVTLRMIQRGITLDLEAHQRQVAKWEAEAKAARQAFIVEAREAPPSTPAETRAFLMKVLPPGVIEAAYTEERGAVHRGPGAATACGCPGDPLLVDHQRDDEAARDIRA
jgi:hypothetical protein